MSDSRTPMLGADTGARDYAVPSEAPWAKALDERLDAARAEWPDIHVPREVFARHVSEKLRELSPGDPMEAVGRIRLPQLFLACACAYGDPQAIAHFEAIYFREVAAAVHRFPSLPVTVADVEQRMRELLFCPPAPARPSVAGYAGLGDLRAWLRAATLHVLLNIASRDARERPTEAQFFERVADAAPDAESRYLKEICRAEFEAAFASALQALSSREKQLLRFAFADGLSVDQIGAIFQVHRATAARWLARARMRLVRVTRRHLMTSLRVNEGEAASIVRAALSRIGPTLLRKL